VSVCVQLDLCSIREDAGQTVKSSVSHLWIKDTRDDKIAASRGYYVKFFHELAGLSGDVSFYKVDVESQLSRSFGHGLVRFKLLLGIVLNFSLNIQGLSLSARSGFLKAIAGRSHFSDRFQLGGPLSLRSFKANGMGPRHGGISKFFGRGILLKLMVPS